MSLAALTLAVLGGTFTLLKPASNSANDDTLQALFPMSLLDAKLTVDPTNLDTIYEYYLLENLASGLVRDDQEMPGGFAPVLAESYSQASDNTWIFRIRSGATWSDGTAIKEDQWVDSFMHLSRSESRHIVALKNLSKVTFDATSRDLTMIFSVPIGETLLHELSLADAVLIHPDNRQGNYQVTSGPYTVIGSNPESRTLDLAAVAGHPLLKQNSPRKIHLFGVKNLDDIAGAFLDYPVDVYLRPTPSARSIFRNAEKNAQQMLKGHATSITFFGFCGADPMAHNQEARSIFAKIVATAFKKISGTQKFTQENQMVPEGYVGRLADVPRYLPEADVKHVTFKPSATVNLNLIQAFKEWPDLIPELDSAAAQFGWKFSYKWNAMTGEALPDGCFASVNVFKGNQKDPLGSWSFLFSEKGALAPFRAGIKGEIDAAGSESDVARRDQHLKNVHLEVLKNHWAVPVLVDGNAILASNRVDLSQLNPFDMRLRYYLMEWRR